MEKTYKIVLNTETNNLSRFSEGFTKLEIVAIFEFIKEDIFKEFRGEYRLIKEKTPFETWFSDNRNKMSVRLVNNLTQVLIDARKDNFKSDYIWLQKIYDGLIYVENLNPRDFLVLRNFGRKTAEELKKLLAENY